MSPSLESEFRRILDTYDRVAIAGGPRTGKTTLASAATDREVISSDDWLPAKGDRPQGKRYNPSLSWSEQSADMVRVTSELNRFVFEGVRAAHALRKGMTVDAVVCLWSPVTATTPDQDELGAGIRNKVFPEWLAQGHAVPVFEL